ncbi:MAG: hypothetical protein Q9195_002044 [Heterodermia aff. obscurata]
MPHTSRKKKPGQSKRLQITDDHGWTHISKATDRSKYQLQYSFSDEKLSPTAIPRGLTIRDVNTSFSRTLKIWKDSSCLKKLQDGIKNTILTADIEITTCVCLGLGSLTGGKLPETSLFELAALVTILESLGAKHQISTVYMQDPIFNLLDEEFLCSLGYTVVSNPAGFTKIGATTFLFAPHLEWPVYSTALQNRSPALCIGNDVQEYLDSPLKAASTEARTGFQTFVQRYQSIDMPDFDRSSWCESTKIYWRRPMDDDAADPP